MKSQVEPGATAGPVASVDADRSSLPVSHRSLALAVGCLLGTLLLLAALSRAGLAAFALGQPRTIPTMLAALLLVVASGSAWLLGRSGAVGGSGLATAWRAVAGLLALLAIEQAASLSYWIAEWLDLPRYSILYLGVLAGVAVLALGTWLLRATPTGALWVVGGAFWLGGQAVEAALGGRWQNGVAAGLELFGCALLALALLLTLPPEYRLWEARGGKAGVRRFAESAVAAVSPRTAARVLFGAIGFFALIGGLLILLDMEFLGPVQNASNPLQWFDLNQELTFPAYFSGLLLATMAGLAVLVAVTPSSRLGSAWPWLGMALVVAFLAVDEVVDFHGRAQRATDTEAQVLLAPLILAAALIGLVLLVRIWSDRSVRWMFLGGAAAWGAAMAIDPSTHPGSPLAFPEEVLEMSGSALFLLALLVLARAVLGLGRDAVPTGADAVAR